MVGNICKYNKTWLSHFMLGVSKFSRKIRYKMFSRICVIQRDRPLLNMRGCIISVVVGEMYFSTLTLT